MGKRAILIKIVLPIVLVVIFFVISFIVYWFAIKKEEMNEVNIPTIEDDVEYDEDLINSKMYTFVYDDFYNGYAIARCRLSTYKKLDIPNTYKGKPVTRILEGGLSLYA